jgi:muramoyltetrapeptide carboxypeptidase
VEAPLIGGNLAILAAMCGTPHAISARGCILFMEDVGEPAYRVDRMLQQLLASGALEGVAGLAFGRFTGSPEEEDEHSVADVLAEVASRLAVPAACDLPFGHTEHNCTVPVGVRARLDGDAAAVEILEAGVRIR